MRKVGLFLLTIALIVGMVGCAPAGPGGPGSPLPYALGVSTTVGGSVAVTIEGEETVVGPGETEIFYDIPADTDVQLAASPAEGYEFVGWAGSPVNGVTDPVVIINMQDNYEVTATFEPVSQPPLTYELTMAANPEAGGTAIDLTNASPYEEGARVSIKAEANEGYQFVRWTAPAGQFDDANDPETTFTMPGQDVTVTANFELIPPPTYQLTLAVNPESGGVAIDLTNASPYEEGARVSIKAEANPGFLFVSWTAPAGEFDDANDPETTFTMPGQDVTVTANFAVEPMIAAGEYHTVGLRADSTVVAVGSDASGQCDVDDWVGVIQVAAGGSHTVGLKFDGTVVAVGDNSYGQCNVSGWEDVIQVAAGYRHTVGLKPDGTVVAVGDNSYGQCNVGGWEDIVQVAAGYGHTVGLKSDGTVVAVGTNFFGQCDVGAWQDIVEVTAGHFHTVGLRLDGTVVAVGWNEFGQCNVGGWDDIVQVAAGYYHTVGVKFDGTVVAVGRNDFGQCNVSGWQDIMQVAAGYKHTVGLKYDGSVVAVGDNAYAQCDVDEWDLM